MTPVTQRCSFSTATQTKDCLSIGTPNCRSTSRPPPPSRVPFSPALSDASVEFTTNKINEVNGTKARLSDYGTPISCIILSDQKIQLRKAN